MVASSIIARPYNTITSSKQGTKRNSHDSDQRNSLNSGRLYLRTHQDTSPRPTPDLRGSTSTRHPPRRNPTSNGTTSLGRIRLRSPSRVHLGATASLSTKRNAARVTNPVTPATTSPTTRGSSKSVSLTDTSTTSASSFTLIGKFVTSTGDFYAPVGRFSYNFTIFRLQNSGSSTYKWDNFLFNETLQPGISIYNSGWRTDS